MSKKRNKEDVNKQIEKEELQAPQKTKEKKEQKENVIKEVSQPDKNKTNKDKTYNKNLIYIIAGIAIIGAVAMLFATSKEEPPKTTIKSSLDRVVKQGNLETVNFTYNVVAKQCKKKGCNKKSNKIEDYEYVISCKGSITAYIDFEKVKLNVNEDKKTIKITLPSEISTEIIPGTVTFLNGDDVPADELPKAKKLCADTIKEKSEKDGNLIPSAKDQAEVVLKSYYNQWLKAFDEEYKIEIEWSE